ncbi:hypothetical protein CROQUDRAFT_667459 [Cronartium quercuum f. sp. fusiforme G11]|uniref:CRA domain-containing protein n=1 Tax=Cronartium quercuum f. sp. fusiforme G11 TaxID=708437 RepID=A0A9P6NUE1_9BASI|nr:hypothetical protein CROQUDRAFT_667459 [Cronartium quercuum f. sp. fusiforme G11]
MSHPRILTDPSLPSATLQPDCTNNAMSMLNQYGPKRSTDHAELRKLVLDYLCHQCFVDTAAAFAREAPIAGSAAESEPIAQKSMNGFVPIHMPVPAVKDNVVERTVRFDTDEDGDAEMGEIQPRPSSSNMNKNTNADSKALGSKWAATVDQPTNGFSKNGLEDETMAEPIPTPSSSSVAETYPDWTAHDIQTTQLRLVIKEHIVAGRLKEAIELINHYFPAVLGPSSLSKLHTTSHLPASTNTSSPLKPTKAHRPKPSRVMFAAAAAHASRPLGGPTPTGSRQPSFSSPQPTNGHQTSSWSSILKEPEPSLVGGPRSALHHPEEFPHAMFSSLQPAHVALNLQIQYFVELVRTSSSSSPELSTNGNSNHENEQVPTTSSRQHTDLATSTGGLSDDTSTSTTSTISARTHSVALSLPHARSLFCYVQTLPKPTERAIFVKELESVSGLLAYTDPWHSPVRRYLDQSRRLMLAEIVNAAILVNIGRSPTPILKMVAQQTSFTWSTLNEMGERIGCPRPEDKNRTRACNFFNLSEFIGSHDATES